MIGQEAPVAVLRKSFRLIISGLVCLLLAGSVWFLMNRLTEGQEEKILSLEETVESLEESWVPLRFQIREREEAAFTVKVKLYDLENRIVGEETWELPGREFFVDFMTIPAGERLYLSFPRAVFTDTLQPSRGKSLYPLYNQNGNPLIFRGESIPAEGKAVFRRVFETLLQGERAAEEGFGNVVHDIQSVREFRKGYVYRVQCRRKGGIEIAEE